MFAIKHSFAGLALSGLVCASASAATAQIGIDPRNTIPNTRAIGIIADGQGVDWTGGVLLIELTSGSVYNGAPDSNGPQSAFWNVPGFEKLEWDTWFGVPGDGTNGIAGGAGDLGGPALQVTGQTISVTWFNTKTTDTGLLRVGNVTLSDDAVGTFSMILSFADGTLIRADNLYLEVWPENILPPPWPEPGTLALLGVGSLALMRGGRRG